jgi:hypothetical protein
MASPWLRLANRSFRAEGGGGWVEVIGGGGGGGGGGPPVNVEAKIKRILLASNSLLHLTRTG